ncbi:MAG: GAF domain-containing protein, partial [Chloroflexia bacterium]
LRQVGLELTGELDLSRLLESIARRAVELLGADGGGLYLYRPDLDALEWRIGVGAGLPPVGTLLRRGNGLSGTVWEQGKPLAVDDYARWERRARVHNGLPNVATASAPVYWGEEFLGVLNVVAQPGRVFTPAEVELLSLFASQAAVAIHNAQTYEAARKRAERLAVVNHVARAVGTVLRLDELLEIVYRETMSIFAADSFFIALYDAEREELDFRLLVDEGVRHPPERSPVGSGLTSLVVARKQPLLIRNLPQEQDRLPTPLLWGTMQLPASWLGVPMCVGERLVGVICVQSYTPNAYDEEDQQLLSTVADQVAVAVERARLYEAIAESEQKHRLLLQSIGSPVVALTRDLTVLYCNEAYARLMNCAPEELEGRPLLEFAPSFARSQSYAAYLRVLETSQAESVEGRMGNSILRAWVYPTPWGILAIAEDVTERRRLEELLRQTQKMEAIGTLAGGIAHDFNNLLTGILGYASVLQQEVPPDSVLYRDLGAIVDSAIRASELTQQLLTVARSSLQREWNLVDLNKIVQEVIGLLEHALDPSITIRLRLAEALRAVQGDAGQLHQTLLNLCL